MILKKSYCLLLVLLLTPLVLVGVVQSVAPPSISINLSSYGIYVYGSGWTANADVTVYYDVEDADHMVAKVTANYAGNFQTYIPTNYVATVGTHTVIAVQGTDKATAVYDVGVVAPPDDRLLNPIHSIEDKLNDVDTEVKAIEAKLDPGGSFYNFVNAWFTTVDNKINTVDNKVDTVDGKVDVVEGKVDDVDNKIDTRMDALEDRLDDIKSELITILANYEGNWGTGGEISEDVTVPGTHIQTDKSVLFTVTYALYPDDDTNFLVSTKIGGGWWWGVVHHDTDDTRRGTITFSGKEMRLRLWDGSDVWALNWVIMVRGTPDTVVTVIE